MNIWIADSSRRRVKLNKIINKICSSCNVTVFTTPVEILTYPTDVSCNVLFVAADTPEFDWVKVVKHIKEHYKTCNIIFYSNIELKQRDYLRYRISGFLQYPFDEQKLEQELDNLRFTIKK